MKVLDEITSTDKSLLLIFFLFLTRRFNLKMFENVLKYLKIFKKLKKIKILSQDKTKLKDV